MAGLQGVETMTAIDEMKESVKALMEMFRLPSETDFLIYRILKDYRGDFKQASSKIFEGIFLNTNYIFVLQSVWSFYACCIRLLQTRRHCQVSFKCVLIIL